MVKFRGKENSNISHIKLPGKTGTEMNAELHGIV